jgi:glycosyltransferase involved in cell wall biosynthesis
VKVAIVIDTLEVGGAERSLIDIASRLRGTSATFVTCYPGNSLAPALASAGLRRVALDVSGRYAFASVARRLSVALARIGPDIVHACLFRAEVAARLAVPSTVPLLGSFVNASYAADRYERLLARGRLKLDVVRAIDTATLPRCSAFVANSVSVARENVRALGIAPSTVEVIHRGRDGGMFRPASSRAARRDERAMLGWGDDDVVVLNVARLLERKGHAELLRACAESTDAIPGVRLVLVGDGPERQRLEALADSLGIASRVTFAGTRDDVPRLLRCCDLFAFPSHYEGHPGSLVEAMLSGCRIVASDIGPNLETVTAGETAEVFPVGDAAALATAMRRALASGDEQGSRAREAALQRFDLDVVARAHRDLYERVITAHARRTPFVARPWA